METNTISFIQMLAVILWRLCNLKRLNKKFIF